MLPKVETDTYVTLKCKYSSSIERKDEESREFFKFLGKLHFNNFFIRRNGKVSLTGNSHQTLRTNIDGCNIYMNAYGYTNGIQWECPEFDTNYVIEL